MEGAAVHTMSGWHQAAWSAGPSLSAVLSFGEGHHQHTSAPLHPLWGHRQEGLEPGHPGMNLGPQPSPGFVLVHLKAGLQPSDCADSGERSLRLTAGQEAGCRGHGTAALRFRGTSPFSGMLKQGRQRQLIYLLQGRIQPGTGAALT